MSTLLLRLAAPLQSWGIDKFERRGTERTPTKSGVIGLVAAALGRRRDESIEDLQALRFGVRIEQAGMLLRDLHMAHEVEFWKKHDAKYTYMTNRYYLADAVFLGGLEGDKTFLAEIENALCHPAFPLFLGRRSCPPEGKLSLGIRTGKTLLEALREEPWLSGIWSRRKAEPEVHLRIIADSDEREADAYFQRDVPLSFDQRYRKFGFRRVSESGIVIIPNPDSRQAAPKYQTKHNPMQELRGE
jgi:CRISPR system Cascade subunit CasD